MPRDRPADWRAIRSGAGGVRIVGCGQADHQPALRDVAGGIATSYPGSYTFDFWRSRIDSMALVSETELVDAAIVMLQETGHLPEGAGAASLAAVLHDPQRYKGRRVVILLSGGNSEQVIWDRLTAEGTRK